jgi:hypothetical protein
MTRPAVDLTRASNWEGEKLQTPMCFTVPVARRRDMARQVCMEEISVLDESASGGWCAYVDEVLVVVLAVLAYRPLGDVSQ